jgi:hypothetical protein
MIPRKDSLKSSKELDMTFFLEIPDFSSAGWFGSAQNIHSAVFTECMLYVGRHDPIQPILSPKIPNPVADWLNREASPPTLNQSEE